MSSSIASGAAPSNRYSAPMDDFVLFEQALERSSRTQTASKESRFPNRSLHTPNSQLWTQLKRDLSRALKKESDREGAREETIRAFTEHLILLLPTIPANGRGLNRRWYEARGVGQRTIREYRKSVSDKVQMGREQLEQLSVLKTTLANKKALLQNLEADADQRQQSLEEVEAAAVKTLAKAAAMRTANERLPSLINLTSEIASAVEGKEPNEYQDQVDGWIARLEEHLHEQTTAMVEERIAKVEARAKRQISSSSSFSLPETDQWYAPEATSLRKLIGTLKTVLMVKDQVPPTFVSFSIEEVSRKFASTASALISPMELIDEMERAAEEMLDEAQGEVATAQLQAEITARERASLLNEIGELEGLLANSEANGNIDYEFDQVLEALALEIASRDDQIRVEAARAGSASVVSVPKERSYQERMVRSYQALFPKISRNGKVVQGRSRRVKVNLTEHCIEGLCSIRQTSNSAYPYNHVVPWKAVRDATADCFRDFQSNRRLTQAMKELSDESQTVRERGSGRRRGPDPESYRVGMGQGYLELKHNERVSFDSTWKGRTVRVIFDIQEAGSAGQSRGGHFVSRPEISLITVFFPSSEMRGMANEKRRNTLLEEWCNPAS